MRNISHVLPLFLSSLLIQVPPLVRQESVEQILSRAQEAYRKARSYHLSGIIAQEWTSFDHKARNFQESFQASLADAGRLRYQRGLGVSKILAVTDGEMSCLYLGEANRYRRSLTADLESFIRTSLNIENAALVFPAIALVDKYRTLQIKFRSASLMGIRNLFLDGRDLSCWVLDGAMEPLDADAVSGKRKTQIWIDRNSYLIRREVSIGTLSDNSASREMLTETITFQAAKVNEPLAEEAFVFDPPEGALETKDLFSHVAETDPGCAFHYELPFAAMSHFKLPDVNGTEIDLGRLRGKLVLLDFWATWCVPCHKQMNDLQKILRRYADKDIAVLGLNSEAPEKTLSFYKNRAPLYPLLTDKNGKLASQYGVDTLPTLVLLDRAGRMILKRERRQTYEQIEHLLKDAGL